MSRLLRSASLLVVGLVALPSAHAADGYHIDTLPLVRGNAFLGGMDVLPDGRLVYFDGTKVVETDLDEQTRELYRPPTFVFGAFLVAAPDGRHLYFGESSYGTIVEIDRHSRATRLVAQTSLPFAMAFDPRGRAFVQWSPGIGLGSFVSLLDLKTGAWDPILSSPEASGPLLFTTGGGLYTVVPDTTQWPPPPDSARLLHFTGTQVDSAVGPGLLTVGNGSLLALLDSGFGLAQDEAGDLFITDALNNLVVEVDPKGGQETILYRGPVTSGSTFLSFVPGTFQGSAGVFEPYQPDSSGHLLWLESDFWSEHDLRRMHPARPRLTTSPPGPVPAGPLTLHLEGGVPGGLAFLMLAAGTHLPELIFRPPNWPFPVFLGLDLSTGINLVPLPLDGQGRLSLPGVNPGLGGASVALQALVGPGSGTPLAGSSIPLELTLQ